MTSVNWPTGLPLKIRYGTGMQFGVRSKLTTEMEFGPLVQRNRFKRANTPYRMNVELTFTDDQYRLFLSFWTNSLYNGIKHFYAPVLTDVEVVTMLCKIVDDELKPVAETYNRWVIPVIFEIRGTYTLSEAAYAIELMWGSDAVDIMDAVDQIVNVDMGDALGDF